MPTWVIIVVVGFIVLDVVAVLAVREWMRRRSLAGKDNAPGWYVFCTDCGRARRLSEVGGVKIGATPRNIRTRSGCLGCGRRGRVRMAHESVMSVEELEIVEAYEGSLAAEQPA